MCESPKSESDESDMTSESAQSVLRPYLVQVSPSGAMLAFCAMRNCLLL